MITGNILINDDLLNISIPLQGCGIRRVVDKD